MQIKILCNFILRCDRWFCFFSSRSLFHFFVSFLFLYFSQKLDVVALQRCYWLCVCSFSRCISPLIFPTTVAIADIVVRIWNSFAIVLCNSLPLFCHRDVFRTWRCAARFFCVCHVAFTLTLKHPSSLLYVCKNRCLPNPVLVLWFRCSFFLLPYAHYNSPSKLNRFSVFFSHRCHCALQPNIDLMSSAPLLS